MRRAFAEDLFQEVSGVRPIIKGLIFQVCPYCKRESGVSCNYKSPAWQETIRTVPHKSVLKCLKAILTLPHYTIGIASLTDVFKMGLPPTLKECVKSGSHKINRWRDGSCTLCNHE